MDLGGILYFTVAFTKGALNLMEPLKMNDMCIDFSLFIKAICWSTDWCYRVQVVRLKISRENVNFKAKTESVGLFILLGSLSVFAFLV